MRSGVASVVAAAGVALLLVACLPAPAQAYLPGVKTQEFFATDPVELKVNKLTSVMTQLPMDYYTLPFCQPDVIMDTRENLGEILRGDVIRSSPYVLNMQVDKECEVLCRKTLSQLDANQFSAHIRNQYRVHWIVDNLPAATRAQYLEDGEFKEVLEDGFPLGFMGNPDNDPDAPNTVPYLNNHVHITIKYNLAASDDKEQFEGARIVGFEVVPLSVQHSEGSDQDGRPLSCSNLFETPNMAVDKPDTEVVFTYRVTWEASDIEWASRWDVYLEMQDPKIHWFSIINSLIIVIFLSGMVGIIMVKNINSDFQKYAQQLDDDDPQDETGWKLVHTDVFRPPSTRPMCLSVMIGSGMQLFVCALITLVFALFGFLSPANRGSLLTALIFLFVVAALFAGYFSARAYKIFQGESTRRNTLMTALMFPGICFCIFFVINLFIWGKKSSGAVPFGTLVAIMAMWFGVSVPLVFLGAYFGFRKALPKNPVETHHIPRQIPDQVWYMRPLVSVMMGGILPFGSVFIELFFLLSSIWLHQFYYIFGFLFIVFLILIVTCAEITIVMTYFQLVAEDYHWWWRAFLTAASSGFYTFLYSIFYYVTKLHGGNFVTALMFIGYSFILSFALFLVTGSIGFFATLWFIRKIYAGIKVD